VCGYSVEPEGTTDNADHEFERLGNDWVCPVCGADKVLFEKIDSVITQVTGKIS
jgi:rubredoxin